MNGNIFDKQLREKHRAEIRLECRQKRLEESQQQLDKLRQEIAEDPSLEPYFGQHRLRL